jgi:hypothetical protein
MQTSMAGNQTTLFPTKPSESNILTIFCSGCSARAFKVDEDTLSNAGIVSLKCPECGNGTSLSIAPNGNIIVVPGYPENNLPKKKTRTRKPETQ